jgi:hypothetical protein
MARLFFNTVLFMGCLVSQFSYGQPPVTIEMGTVINAAGQPVSDGMMIYGAESLKKNVTYADVKGTPYLSDSFRISILYDQKDRVIARVKTRINFYNFNLHFVDQNGQELVVGPDLVKKVQYIDPYDEKKVLQEFSSDVDALNRKFEKPVFVQVMNNGDTRLLKYMHRYVGTYDSLMGQFKRYMFITREDFYMQRQETVEPLRKLNRERVLAFTRYERELSDFATQNKLDFRKENDVVAILDHLNTITKKPK